MADEQLFNQMLEELKAVREEKKIDLESIAEKSRIRLKYLQALEAGQLDKLPQVYDRFIFKTYLNELQVDEPEKYLSVFDEIRKPEKKQTTFFSSKPKQQTSDSENRFIPKSVLLKISYAGIPVLITIVLILILINNKSKVPRQPEKPVKELTAHQIVKQAAEKQASENRQTTAAVKQDSALNIIIQAKGDSWIRYVKDHTDTSDFILKQNNVHSVFADSVVEFKIGNPSALLLSVNSKKYDALAKPGQVITYMKVTPKGITALKAVFPKKRKVVKNDSTSIH